jgi:mRNA interferase MazF
VNRGEIWLAQVGRKSRPVLVMTRPEVIDVRELITVAEITTEMRGIGAEVVFDFDEAGLAEPSAINCDGIHTVARSMLTHQVGSVDSETMTMVCRAMSYALGC